MLAVALEVEPDLEDPRQALPFLNLSANGRTVRDLLDSGAGRTSIAAPLGTTTWPADFTGTGAFGQAYRDQLWRATIAIDGTELCTLDIAAAPTTGQFNVGQDLLSQFRCHFRLADHQLLLGPTHPTNHQPSDGEPIYLDPASTFTSKPTGPPGCQPTSSSTPAHRSRLSTLPSQTSTLSCSPHTTRAREPMPAA